MNRIHPTAVIGEFVELGDRNTIGPYAVVQGTTIIGSGNWIGSHTVIGSPGQVRGGSHVEDPSDMDDYQSVRIGDNNIFREFVTVHRGTEITTTIGSQCYLMAYSHIPHDCLVEDEVTLSNSVQIGGHSVIQHGANIGLGSVVHQRLIVGSGAMVGMGSVVTKDVYPFSLAYGIPASVRGANEVRLKRLGLSVEVIEQTKAAYALLDLEKVENLFPDEFKSFRAVERGRD